MKMEKFSIHFKLISFTPDQRQYKTTIPILAPVSDLIVVVEIPLEHELVYNTKEFILATTSGNKPPDPVLTPKGLAFVEDVLLSRIDKAEEKETSENKTEYTDKDFIPFEEE